MVSVSAVIVTYNRVSLLKQCLDKLLHQSYNLDNIFVVNNNSTDGTYQFLNSLNNNLVKPINMKKNLGGAGGFSIGTKIAYERSNSDCFWIMDDDTMPTTNALSNLISASRMLHNKFGYLCSNVRWWKNNKPSYLNVPVVSRDWNDLAQHGLIKTLSASFVSMLVPRYLVRKVGLPIADMFIWGDDVEYSTRLSQIYPSYFVSNSIVMHKSDKNILTSTLSNSKNVENIFNVSMRRLLYYKCMYRNSLYTSKEYQSLPKVIQLLAKYLFILFEIPFKSKDHKLKRFVYSFKGIFNGLFLFHPKIRFPKVVSKSKNIK